MSGRLAETRPPGEKAASDSSLYSWAPINELPSNKSGHLHHDQESHSEIPSTNSQQPPHQVDHHYHHQGYHDTLPSISPYSTDTYSQQPPPSIDHQYHYQGYQDTIPSTSPYSTDVYSQQSTRHMGHSYHQQTYHNTLDPSWPNSTDAYSQQVTSAATSVCNITTHVKTDPAPGFIMLANDKNYSLLIGQMNLNSCCLTRLFSP